MAQVHSKLVLGWRWWLQLLTNNKVITSGSIVAIIFHNLYVWRRILISKKAKQVELFAPRIVDEQKLDRVSNYFPSTVGRVGVNKQFFRQISSLACILFPSGWWWKGDKLLLTLGLHTIFLVLRTYLSLVVARVDGRLARDLVNRDGGKFMRSLGYWFAVAVPATYTNSMIRYLQSKLTIGFRTRLIDHCHELYLGKHLTYYKLLNLDRSIEGPDQYIAADIAKFCESLSGLYSNLGKPVLDLIIFNYQLAQSIGGSGSAGLMGIYVLTVSLLRGISPAFGKLAAIQTQLEGEFRGAHSRLITNAEEVAFYNGGNLEKSILDRAYFKMIKHVNSVYKVRITYNLIEDFIIKYCWSAVGLVACAVPVFKPHWLASVDTGGSKGKPENGRPASRTQEFITNKRLMLNLGDAGGRIMYSYKELAELAGYTHRVYNLFSTLHSLRRNKFSKPPSSDFNTEKEIFTLDSIRGRKIFGQDGILFENVPIVTPNPSNPNGGDLLVKDLSFEVKPSHHLLVTGPNGVGKTGVARVLRGLWPVFRGTLKQPSIEDIFFVPQKSYLSLGNLRDQIIYPHTHEEMIQAGRTDDELMEILKDVYLNYIPGRDGGFDTVKEWKDVLSGGEKQRVGMARLFYHKPKFAILDECTSAVSSDVEGLMYNHAKELGITLLTISHRPSLFKYHDHLLSLKGDSTGSYELTGIASDAERHTTLSREIQFIKDKLRDVDAWKKRLNEINLELQSGNPPKRIQA